MTRTESTAAATSRHHASDTQVHIRRSIGMRLAPAQARARLVAHDHGILCTVHAARGVDAVPVAFAVDEDDFIGVPVDRVKPKSSSRLQRERNLEADPRATLLVEHWDRDDWSRLWWVRAELRRVADPPPRRVRDLAARLGGRYPQYRDQPFTTVLLLRIVRMTGWAARDDTSSG
jgi:PPOX class probable F420-dependent enzyme